MDTDVSNNMADIAPNLAIVKEINLNKTETWDFSTQFTAEEWSGDKPKELYVRSSAVIYGQPGTPALTSGDTPFGGLQLSLKVSFTVLVLQTVLGGTA